MSSVPSSSVTLENLDAGVDCGALDAAFVLKVVASSANVSNFGITRALTSDAAPESDADVVVVVANDVDWFRTPLGTGPFITGRRMGWRVPGVPADVGGRMGGRMAGRADGDLTAVGGVMLGVLIGGRDRACDLGAERGGGADAAADDDALSRFDTW